MSGGEAKGGGQRILVGVVGAPQGVKGALRIKSYMAVPTAIGDHPLFTGPEGGRCLRLLSVKPLKDAMVVGRVEGIADRDAAAALTGRSLFIDRAGLAPPAEDEFYHADLVGLQVRTEAGVPVGPLAAVVDYGGGDLLEIGTAGGATILIPFLKRFVPTVDLAGGFITVTAEALAPGPDGDEPADEAP